MTLVQVLLFIVLIVVNLQTSNARSLLRTNVVEQSEGPKDQNPNTEDEEDDEPVDESSVYQINSRFETENLVYGDILLTPDQKREMLLNGWGVQRAIAKKFGQNRWSKNVVAYQLSSRFSSVEKAKIHKALADLQSQSCFKFPRRNGHKDYIFVDKRSGCYSMVGRQGGRQLISLGEGCVAHSTILHEFLHALGIQHEHQRPDRDKYIRVEYRNLQSGMKSQVEKISASQVDLYGIPYDYRSIMHYESRAFGRIGTRGRPLKTLVPLKKGVKLRENQQLTSNDLKRLSILGNCNLERRLNSIKKGSRTKSSNRRSRRAG